jgi:hypothetical protein
MAQSFDITSAVASVTASPTTGMRGEVPFTVRNVTGRRLRVGGDVDSAICRNRERIALDTCRCLDPARHC